jgi:hypothetical protein
VTVCSVSKMERETPAESHGQFERHCARQTGDASIPRSGRFGNRTKKILKMDRCTPATNAGFVVYKRFNKKLWKELMNLLWFKCFNRPWKPIGLWDVEAPTSSRTIGSQMSVRLSALRAGRPLTPRKIPGTHFS